MINLLPDARNENIKKAILKLGITSDPFYVDIIPEKGAENGFCYNNVKNKIKSCQGSIVYGWQFCEYDYMIEAEFHSIWKSLDGKLIDVTPNKDFNVQKILFVIDDKRNFNSQKYRDNERFNTTKNELVDDIIELEKIKFRLNGLIYDDNGYLKQYFDISYFQITWIVINKMSEEIEKMFYNKGNIDSKCFCNSNLMYVSCCREILRRYIREV